MGREQDLEASTKPLRSDARRNQVRLLEAAARAFSDHGIDASLEAIARDAGVGIGTLYRHFPSREALVEAVYRREVEQLIEAAEAMGRTEAPDAALAGWMQRFVDYIATKRGMRDTLQVLKESNSPLFAQTSGRLPLALKGLIERAVAAGSIRGDADPVDVYHALSSIYSAADGADWRSRSHRLVSLLMDGLRYGARHPKGRQP